MSVRGTKSKLSKKTSVVNPVIDAFKEVTNERLDKYFAITKEALDMVLSSPMDESRLADAEDLLCMAKSYFSDAKHFRKKGDFVLAFAAVNYAHAWLDAGARLKLFKVNDSRLFAAD